MLESFTAEESHESVAYLEKRYADQIEKITVCPLDLPRGEPIRGLCDTGGRQLRRGGDPVVGTGQAGDHLIEFPRLEQRLSGASHGKDRAAGPLRQRVRDRVAGRVLPVGDAAGYVDALTGEGLGIALGGARVLVDSVLADTPGDYDRQWRQMSRRYRFLTAGLLEASGCKPVRSMIVPVAETCRGLSVGS